MLSNIWFLHTYVFEKKFLLILTDKYSVTHVNRLQLCGKRGGGMSRENNKPNFFYKYLSSSFIYMNKCRSKENESENYIRKEGESRPQMKGGTCALCPRP